MREHESSLADSLAAARMMQTPFLPAQMCLLNKRGWQRRHGDRCSSPTEVCVFARWSLLISSCGFRNGSSWRCRQGRRTARLLPNVQSMQTYTSSSGRSSSSASKMPRKVIKGSNLIFLSLITFLPAASCTRTSWWRPMANQARRAEPRPHMDRQGRTQNIMNINFRQNRCFPAGKRP
jgi:hypothetical protein